MKCIVSFPLRYECRTRLVWLVSSTSLVPTALSRAGVADPLGQAPGTKMPAFPHTHLGSASSALLRGRAASGPRARSSLFPPVQLSPGAARGRSGVWWARSGGSCAFPPRQRRRERQRRWRRRLESRCRVLHPGSGRDPAAAAAEM